MQIAFLPLPPTLNKKNLIEPWLKITQHSIKLTSMLIRMIGNQKLIYHKVVKQDIQGMKRDIAIIKTLLEWHKKLG